MDYRINLDNVISICQVLNVDVDDFYRISIHGNDVVLQGNLEDFMSLLKIFKFTPRTDEEFGYLEVTLGNIKIILITTIEVCKKYFQDN